MQKTRLGIIGFFALLTLGSCKDLVQVQRNYVGDRDQCRARAEGQVGVYSAPGSIPASDKDRNTVLLQLFCECMKGHEWNVAGCPKLKDVAGKSSAPAAAGAAAVQAAPAGNAQPPAAGATVVIIQAPATPAAPPAIIVPGPPPMQPPAP